jgi:hypothetical protein
MSAELGPLRSTRNREARMCRVCGVLEEELSRRQFYVLLCRAHTTKAPVGEQFEAMRALNEPELQLAAAQENLVAHKAEHASHVGKDK